MEKGITVIVCTFNGAQRLPKTIEHLAMQSAIGKLGIEIIVVDNNSTDNSTRVSLEEWDKYNLKETMFKVLFQPKPGKIYALEMAITIANFEYCVICDDDNWLDDHYLEKCFDILESDPKIGAVGGTGIPVPETGAIPDWFKDVEEGYACGTQGPFSTDVTSRGHLWGAGLATRIELYKEIYSIFPSFLTGRYGSLLTAGEDAEYCQRLILKGYRLYYSSELVFHHFMPSKRLTLQYKEDLFNGFKESNKILEKYYLANNIIAKCKKDSFSRIRLLLISPLRIITSISAQEKEKQKETFIFLYPFRLRRNSVISKIKQLYSEISNTSS